jgi:hypothetical protein
VGGATDESALMFFLAKPERRAVYPVRGGPGRCEMVRKDRQNDRHSAPHNSFYSSGLELFTPPMLMAKIIRSMARKAKIRAFQPP